MLAPQFHFGFMAYLSVLHIFNHSPHHCERVRLCVCALITQRYIRVISILVEIILCRFADSVCAVLLSIHIDTIANR